MSAEPVEVERPLGPWPVPEAFAPAMWRAMMRQLGQPIREQYRKRKR